MSDAAPTPPTGPLSHIDAAGAAHMVDVTAKTATRRTAVAAGSLHTSAQVVELISAGGLPKGDALATARVAGETAPLLFTAFSDQFFSLNLTKPIANLPVTINNFVQSPYAYWKQLAWSGALIITLAVLALNIGARILGAERTAK